MTILFLGLIIAAISIFYLSLNHQRWRVQALNKKFRMLAILLLVAALFCGLYTFSLGTTIFTTIVIGMLLLSLFPFLSLLKLPLEKSVQLKNGENNGH